jgi:tetratricopeptide (TPR) repeat protein
MDLSEFDIDFLSQKLSDNPQSPLFARLADLYLAKNQSAEALKLCEAGVQTYSSYATGYVVLGKCYSALNENSKARLAFTQALHLAPFNQLARKLLEEIPLTTDEPIPTQEIEAADTTPPTAETAVQEESLPVQNADEPQLSIETIAEVPVEEEAAQESVQQTETEIVETPPVEPAQLPGVDEYIQQHSLNAGTEEAMSLDEYLDQAAAPIAPEPTELDSLATQLENAGRIVPQEPEPSLSPEESAPLDSIVITPTLAEIYASQGEYGAAIQAYEILIYSKPNERERFEKRISELQAKLNEGG